jgi:hypothetical protein
MKAQTNLGGKNSCVFFSISNWVFFSFENQTVLCKWKTKKKVATCELIWMKNILKFLKKNIQL